MMMNFSFFLSEKLFTCLSIINDRFTGQSNLGCRSQLFITLNISCQSLLACKISFEKPADSLMRTPLGNCFLLLLLRFFMFESWHFNYDESWFIPLYIHLVCFLDLYVYFLHKLGKFSFIIFQIDFQFLALSFLLLAPL